MENDLIINGKDAYKTWKVCMGSKFLDNLETPPPLKDYITSGSRTENGQRVIVSPRIDSRDVSFPSPFPAPTGMTSSATGTDSFPSSRVARWKYVCLLSMGIRIDLCTQERMPLTL